MVLLTSRISTRPSTKQIACTRHHAADLIFIPPVGYQETGWNGCRGILFTNSLEGCSCISTEHINRRRKRSKTTGDIVPQNPTDSLVWALNQIRCNPYNFSLGIEQRQSTSWWQCQHRRPKRNMRVCMGKTDFETVVSATDSI